MSKYYYTIGEVSNLLEVKPHVLRYWESEIPAIRPRKGGHQRRYSLQQIEVLKKIKDMLYTQRFTIEGARQKLKQDKTVLAITRESTETKAKPEPSPLSPAIVQELKDLREGLQRLKLSCKRYTGSK